MRGVKMVHVLRYLMKEENHSINCEITELIARKYSI